MPDEYVDAGLWGSTSLRFRVMKNVERWLLSQADGIGGADRARSGDHSPCWLRRYPPRSFPAVSNCRRTHHRRMLPSCRRSGGWGLEGRRVVLYVGSTTGLLPVRRDGAVRSCRPANGPIDVLPGADPARCRAGRCQDHRWRAGSGSVLGAIGGAAEVAEHAVAADMALSFIPATYSSGPPRRRRSPSTWPVACQSSQRRGRDIDRQISDHGVGVLVPIALPAGYAERSISWNRSWLCPTSPRGAGAPRPGSSTWRRWEHRATSSCTGGCSRRLDRRLVIPDVRTRALRIGAAPR